MSIVVDFRPVCRVTKTVDAADSPYAVGAGSTSQPYDIFANGRFSSSDSIAPGEGGGKEYTLTSGAPTTIDLTAIASLENDALTETLTGKQAMFLKIVCNPANTGTVTLDPSGADDYLIFGAAFKIILQPGAVLMLGMVKKTNGTMPAWGLPDVDATHKNLRVSTNVTGSKIDLLIVAG
jgi:hypothetical protein